MTIDLTKILRESMPTFSEARLGKIVKGGPGSGRHTEIHPAFPFGKEGSLEGAKATPEQVAKVLETEEAHGELNRLITGSTEIRNTPIFGGCLMTAQALNIIFPNAVMKASITTSLSHIESATERGGTPLVDHFVLSVGGDKYLDARGVITEPHALDLITSIDFGKEPKPMSNGLFFNHLVDATPAIIKDAKGYMSSPEGAPEKFAQYILDHIVSKGGVGSGRYPKGSKWTTVGRITPEVAEFITTNANKFYKAGGTIIKVKSGATKLPNGKSLDEARSEIHQKAVELANVKRLTPERKRLIEGYQMMRRNLAMLNKENNREAYIALDKDGNIVGVMGAIQHRTGKDWKITELGSTNEISGTATALEHYIASVAGQTNLESVSTADAINYHTAIGRTLAPIIHPFDKTPTGSFTSTWTLEEMQAIAQLPIGKKYLNVESN